MRLVDNGEVPLACGMPSQSVVHMSQYDVVYV